MIASTNILGLASNNAPNFNFSSERVAQASTAMIAYAAKAATSRFKVPTLEFLVHRGGFEPPNAARADRFTVCWL
jgi:hypothetical protein